MIAEPGDRITTAAAALAAGLPVLVTDDADRENEGDVVMSAATAGEQWMRWMIRNTSGIVCAPMTGSRAVELDLPQMVTANRDPRRTAYTVSVDAAVGIGTGISAADRTRTLSVLAAADSTAGDLIRPGHVFPLRAHDGGVVERAGHTEAAVELCELAGVAPVGVIAELIGEDGAAMRGAEVEDLGRRLDLPVLTIAELVGYRNTVPRIAPLTPRVRRMADTTIDTEYGTLRAVGYLDTMTGAEHIALVHGELEQCALVRVHSECLTGEAFHSHRCECGPQLDAALARISREGGVVVYLRGHEGRGIGLLKKLSAYGHQDRGLDTVAANHELGEPADSREYGSAGAILTDLGVHSARLMTNNPAKISGLEHHGIPVIERVPHLVGATPGNLAYLRTKRERMGHMFPEEALLGLI